GQRRSLLAARRRPRGSASRGALRRRRGRVPARLELGERLPRLRQLGIAGQRGLERLDRLVVALEPDQREGLVIVVAGRRRLRLGGRPLGRLDREAELLERRTGELLAVVHVAQRGAHARDPALLGGRLARPAQGGLAVLSALRGQVGAVVPHAGHAAGAAGEELLVARDRVLLAPDLAVAPREQLLDLQAEGAH